MRFRIQKNPKPKTKKRFAWWPKRMANGTWIWLERYHLVPFGEYGGNDQ